MKLVYILSLPRSGSTVLSAMLDRYKGIISPPESCFPQVLSAISDTERNDRRWLAALYFGATFTPTPLTLDDAEACMIGSNEDILISLGKAVAMKLGRDPDHIHAIVWKTPRMVGMHGAPLSTSGKFIVLRRNPHNIFESQFRVGFGKNNRNPYRFAVFRESYEHAFGQIPDSRKIEIHYDQLPGVLTEVLRHLDITEEGIWENHISSLDAAAKSCSHMTEVTQDFHNRDPEKRQRLNREQVQRLEFAMKLARPLRFSLGPVRAFFDNQSMKNVRHLARQKLSDDGYPNQI